MFPDYENRCQKDVLGFGEPDLEGAPLLLYVILPVWLALLW